MPLADVDLIESALLSVVESVWTTMLRRPVLPIRGAGGTQPMQAFGSTLYTASSTLSGGWEGSLLLHCADTAAAAHTRWLLGDTDEPLLETDVVDCMGELVNMACGNLKAFLPGVTRISLPSVVVGVNYRVLLPGGSQVCRVACATGGRHRIDFVLLERSQPT